MNENFVASMVALLFVVALAYLPVIWIVSRYVTFRPFIRFLYGLTAVPVFVGLLLIDIGLVVRIWPAGPLFLQQARPLQDRAKIFCVLLVLCIMPVLGSWLWYRFFAWLNRFADLDPPDS